MNDQKITANDGRVFRVKVGHAEVKVQARSRVEAIRLARARLSQEIPRMWDVIYTIDESKFCVDPPH